LLIDKKSSESKVEDVLTMFSSYLLRLPVTIDSFEWLFSLRYYSNQQISIQVRFDFRILNCKNKLFDLVFG